MKILVIHNFVPKPDLSGSDKRLDQVIHELVALGHSLSFVSLFPCIEKEYVEKLKEQGIETFVGDSQRLCLLGIQVPELWSFDEVLRSGPFDFAILTLWFWHGLTVPELYMNHILAAYPSCRICTLTDDRHGERQSQIADYSGLFLDRESSYDYSHREAETYRRSDLVVTIARAEADEISGVIPRSRILIVPFYASINLQVAPYESRSGLVFLANFSNRAARDAMKWFLTRCWPDISARVPAVHLTIAGTNSRETIESEFHNVHIVGHVDDLRSLFASHRVFVSPVNYGTGIATKNILALSHGIPVITTTFGASSLKLVPGIHAIVGKRPSDIIEGTIHVYEHPEVWRRLSRAGIALVAEHFAEAPFRYSIQLLLSSTSNTPDACLSRGAWSVNSIDNNSTQYPITRPSCSAFRRGKYVELGEELLRRGNHRDALVQLRHACSISGFSWDNDLYSRLVRGILRCQREAADRSDMGTRSLLSEEVL